MKAVIIDDEHDARVNLAKFLELYCPEVDVYDTADNLASATELLAESNPDLVFLDIRMPDGSGLELVEKFQDRKFHIIFTTSYHEYAVRALRLSALDYLLKPIDIEELKNAVNRALIKQSTQVKEQVNLLKSSFVSEKSNPQIAIKDAKGIQVLPLAEVIYCEADGRYLTFHMLSRSRFTATQHLKVYQEKLEANGFVRTHHRFMVNSLHIRSYKSSSVFGRGGVLVTSNGIEIPVSMRKKQMVVAHIMDNA